MANKTLSKSAGENKGSNDAGVSLMELDEADSFKPSIAEASPSERPGSQRTATKRRRPRLNAPWSLHFHCEGTEDVAVVCDSDGHDLATSRYFWMPEDHEDIPPTLAGMWAMASAPELLQSLREMIAYNLSFGQPKPGSNAAKQIAKARAVIAKATGK